MTMASLTHSLLISLCFHTHYSVCWYASVAYFCGDMCACLANPKTRFRTLFLLHHAVSLVSLFLGLVPTARLFKPMAEFFVAAECSNVALNLSKWGLSRVESWKSRQVILLLELAVYGWYRCVVLGNIVLQHLWTLEWYLIAPAFFLYALGVGWTILIANQIFHLWATRNVSLARKL